MVSPLTEDEAKTLLECVEYHMTKKRIAKLLGYKHHKFKHPWIHECWESPIGYVTTKPPNPTTKTLIALATKLWKEKEPKGLVELQYDCDNDDWSIHFITGDGVVQINPYSGTLDETLGSGILEVANA